LWYETLQKVRGLLAVHTYVSDFMILALLFNHLH